MIHRIGVWLAVCLVGFAASALGADEDKDLDLIPQAAPPSTETGSGSNRNAIVDAFQVTPRRGGLAVPVPSPAPSQWKNWLYLDTRDEWQLAPGLSATYSGRLNFSAADRVPFPDHQDVRNDLREAFLSWQPTDGVWLDLGRINLKSGVAVGSNPTDFFKTRAVVETLTADPTVLREDRLGTLMVLGQYVWSGGSVTAAFAPRVTSPTAVYTGSTLPSFDPMLDRTNAQDRVLLKGSITLADGINPEVLYYHAGNRDQIGANLTAGLGRQTVVYLEWAGGVRASLIDDALRYGIQTRTLPASALNVIPNDATRRFENDLAAGFSLAPADTKITLNLEYHFHEAAFTQRDWRNWFAASAQRGGFPGVNSTLWYIRSYAQDQQEPTSRHTAFFRLDWVDAFIPDLEITALGSIGLVDGSVLLQATADYYLSRSWTIGGLVGGTFGTRHSDYGSLPTAASALFRVVRYF